MRRLRSVLLPSFHWRQLDQWVASYRLIVRQAGKWQRETPVLRHCLAWLAGTEWSFHSRYYSGWNNVDSLIEFVSEWAACRLLSLLPVQPDHVIRPTFCGVLEKLPLAVAVHCPLYWSQALCSTPHLEFEDDNIIYCYCANGDTPPCHAPSGRSRTAAHVFSTLPCRQLLTYSEALNSSTKSAQNTNVTEQREHTTNVTDVDTEYYCICIFHQLPSSPPPVTHCCRVCCCWGWIPLISCRPAVPMMLPTAAETSGCEHWTLWTKTN